MAVLMIMAHKTSTSKSNASNVDAKQVLKPMFHDFLGMKPMDSPPSLLPKATDSTSLSASSAAARPPISSTSDLASERQVGNHLEGVPFYGPRRDISATEISNRVLGSKRSNSDSAFTGHDSLDSRHLMSMKILCNGTAGERLRRISDDEGFLGVPHLRPASASLILQPPGGSRIDVDSNKWERTLTINANSAVKYPPRGGQFVPFMHQVPSNRFKDANAGPSIISQTAADEGSRTGIKGTGILTCNHASSGVAEKNSSGLLSSGSRLKSGTHTSEPESSTPPSQQGLTSSSRQMTIFYGGQAHVFDDVHPNKADVIMALAGSNGGSWSTTYSAKSIMKPVNESNIPSGESEGGGNVNRAFPQEFRGILAAIGNTSQGIGSADRISTPGGGHHSGGVTGKESRNSIQAADPIIEENKRV